MAERITHIRQRHETTNTTDRHLVVANYHIILGSYEKASEAHNALLAMGSGSDGLAETPYARVAVLAPGESTAGELMLPVTWDDGTDAAAELMRSFGA